MAEPSDAISKLLIEADSAMEAGEWEAAGELCATALEAEPDNVDALYLMGVACVELCDPEGAAELLKAAVEIEPSFAEAHAELAFALFELCRFKEAEGHVKLGLDEDTELGMAIFVRALLSERKGKFDKADADFARLSRIDPDGYPPPVRFSAKEFDQFVRAALESLPEKVAVYLRNVSVQVEPVPTDVDIQEEPPLSPQLMGLFRGTPAGEKSLSDPWSWFPDAIVIYQRNIERMCTTREELADEIRTTVLHEVGHFLGLDEEQVAELGLA